MNKLWKRIFSVCLICALCVSSMSFQVSAEKTDADFKQEISALEKQIEAEENRKESSQQTASEKLKKIELMQEQLNVYNERIAALNAQIAEKDAKIAEFQREIDALLAEIKAATEKQEALNAEIQGTYDELGDRLYATYVSGETSTLEILLTAEDFETFLTRLEFVKRVAEYDAEIVASLQEDVDALNAIKAQLDKDQKACLEKQESVQSERNAVASDRAEQKKAASTVESKQTALEQEVSKLTSLIGKYDQNIDQLEQDLEKAKDEYDAYKSKDMESGSGVIDNSSISNYPVSSKGMIRPLQYKNVAISAGWYGYPGHKGIDFITSGATGNTYGKEIRVAADGVVYSAEFHFSWGYNVYVNHGNGVYTRYAHCSKMFVSKGTQVKQGQVIAYVGNSGNVSPKPTAANPHAGAHLHFEVWVNGVRVNPTSWLP